jgi:hypothetical protein
MPSYSAVAQLLAIAFLDSRWDKAALLERCDAVFGKTPRWCGPVVDRLLANFPETAAIATIAAFLEADEGFHQARLHSIIGYQQVAPRQMRPKLPIQLDIPSLRTTRELAEWLGVKITDLEWFADLKTFARHARAEQLSHYRYRVLAKRFGSVRLIESPKPRLKAIQRHILRHLLDRVPPHEAAHGFRAGRSITTFAAPHVGQPVVARIDLRDFFPCVTRARVAAMFRTVGYPESVAELLAGLCTTVTPPHVWGGVDLCPRTMLQSVVSRHRIPHLPQGGPTSPATANLCAYRLDRRLTGLARAAGGNYTRYADDLAFSGDNDFARGIKRFLVHVAATVAEEGFIVHHHKTRIMRDGVRQHLAGVVVNERVNVRRRDYDELKATLTNCARHGPTTQNRTGHADFRAHLRGRIAFVMQLHPERGKKLKQVFGRINW